MVCTQRPEAPPRDVSEQTEQTQTLAKLTMSYWTAKLSQLGPVSEYAIRQHSERL